MILKDLTNEILHANLKGLARDERELTLKVLHHLREVERRSLYAELGYSSLFEFCTHELKYSEGAAQRRISAMRLLRDLPADEVLKVEDKIEKGSLSLMALSQAQTFFKKEKTRTEEKKEILQVLENKSHREVERELVKRSTEPANLFIEKIRPVAETHTELKVIIEENVLKEIEELKTVLGTAKAAETIGQILSYAVSYTLNGHRPKAPKTKSAKE